MKTKIVFLLACIVSLFSCDQIDNKLPPIPEGTEYAKLVFIDNDDSYTTSGIYLLNQYSAKRTSGDVLTVTEDIILSSGDFDAVNVKNDDVKITITGIVNFKNYNGNTKKVLIDIKPGAELYVQSSQNFNGSLSMNIDGYFESGNVELQGNSGSGNFVTGKGRWKVNGNFQLSSPLSNIDFCGAIVVTGHTSLHKGSWNFCNCATLTTNGLDVNGENLIKGKGFIKVLDNLNLNQNLTESSSIQFSYCKDGQPREIKKIEKLGAAVRICEPACQPLPIKFTNAKVYKEGTTLTVSFNITESSNVKELQVFYSTDAREWTMIDRVSGDKLLPDTKFKQTFSIE